MKDSIVKTVELTELLNKAVRADYIDEYIIATNNLSDIFGNQSELRLNFCIIIICLDGYVHITMNEHEYTLQKGDLFISLPYSILGNITLSDNNSIKVFGLSSDFIKSIAKREKRIDAVIASVHGNPVYNIYENQEKQSVINTYSQLAIEKVNDSNTYMKKDILRYMFSAIFCEVMAEIGSNSNSIEFKSADTGNAMRVFKLFLKELSKDDGRHRSVSYYADLVCYSPKYLSHVVKSVSGRTAMSFINEHTIKQIKYQLLYSDKSIKEIAEEFNFPNLSFFGKYVKRNVGVSPIQFRTQSSNTKQ